MIVFLNGQFVPEAQAVVSVFDRAFLYGDGLFETIRVANGKPFRWAAHLERLQRGADFLGIAHPFREPLDAAQSLAEHSECKRLSLSSPEFCAENSGNSEGGEDQSPNAPSATCAHTLSAASLYDSALELLARNALPVAVLRLTLSRGVGRRGYSPKGADQPTAVMTLHPAPDATPQALRWKLITATGRLPARTPLAQFKTGNKLPQILARAEADAAGADDALLLNTDGYAVESSSGNLFWVDTGVVCTPPLISGVLPGVTRQVVLESCRALGLPTQEAAPRPKELLRAEGVFLTLSSVGVVAVIALDGHALAESPLTGRIQESYRQLIEAETS